MPLTAADILNAAALLVSGSRASEHGPVGKNQQAIADLWNGYMQARDSAGKPEKLTAEDAANMMELLKVARRLTGSFNLDDYIDGAGYAALAGEIKMRDGQIGAHETDPPYQSNTVSARPHVPLGQTLQCKVGTQAVAHSQSL